MRETDQPLPEGETLSRRGTPIRGISAVVAAYGAAESLAALVEAILDTLLDAVPEYELIIVDDGSRDATARIAGELAAAHPTVRALQQRRQGFGAAWRLGATDARHQYTLLLDAGHHVDPGDLVRLIQWGDRYDIVAGYRLQRPGPLPQRLGSWLFARLTRSLLGISGRDPTCAFVLLRTSWLRSVPLGTDGPLLLTEIRAQAARQGIEVREVGVRYTPRKVGGGPSSSARATVGALPALLALRQRLKRER